MLPKKHRLTKDEVEYVQKYGKVMRTSQAVIRYSTAVNGRTIDICCAKFAVVVSKKIAHDSVVRHALKRAVYRAVQESGLHTRTTSFLCAVTLIASPDTYTADTIHTTIIPALRTCMDEV
jgi:RNase P protein component